STRAGLGMRNGFRGKQRLPEFLRSADIGFRRALAYRDGPARTDEIDAREHLALRNEFINRSRGEERNIRGFAFGDAPHQRDRGIDDALNAYAMHMLKSGHC